MTCTTQGNFDDSTEVMRISNLATVLVTNDSMLYAFSNAHNLPRKGAKGSAGSEKSIHFCSIYSLSVILMSTAVDVGTDVECEFMKGWRKVVEVERLVTGGRIVLHSCFR